MADIQIKDKTFEPYIEEIELQSRITELADQINKDFATKNPLFIGVLNGSFIFASDLYKNIDIPSEISFVKFTSYEGTESKGTTTELIGLNENLKGREVIVVEDIVDTGRTLKDFLGQLEDMGAANVHVITLLDKKEARQHEIPVKYCGFEIDNKFVVGYGLDYDGYGRNTKEIYKLKS